MFNPENILYEDNHLLVVNKCSGELVQPDPSGTSALENEIKDFLKIRDHKPGNVFLGVVHRIDRPVSGAVLFAKSNKALVRLNEMLKNKTFQKTYWAITEHRPKNPEDTLVGQLVHDGRNNKSYLTSKPTTESKEARLRYKIVAESERYTLLEVELLTGRHHQIRCQLAQIGCTIKGDLKYGARRSNPDGSISLHARTLTFEHPIRKEILRIVAPAPIDDKLWRFFEETLGSH